MHAAIAFSLKSPSRSSSVSRKSSSEREAFASSNPVYIKPMTECMTAATNVIRSRSRKGASLSSGIPITTIFDPCVGTVELGFRLSTILVSEKTYASSRGMRPPEGARFQYSTPSTSSTRPCIPSGTL